VVEVQLIAHTLRWLEVLRNRTAHGMVHEGEQCLSMSTFRVVKSQLMSFETSLTSAVTK